MDKPSGMAAIYRHHHVVWCNRRQRQSDGAGSECKQPSGRHYAEYLPNRSDELGSAEPLG